MNHSNQTKIEAIIKQAQANGWMPNASIVKIKEVEGISSKIWVITFDVLYLAQFPSSFSDIIFDKDFAEKFFPEDCRGDDCMDIMTPENHMHEMLSMSDQQRIDFLYKHVVEKEDEMYMNVGNRKENGICKHCGVRINLQSYSADCNHVRYPENCEICLKNEKIAKEEPRSSCSCGCTITMPHSHLVVGQTCECEKGDSKPIEKIGFITWDGHRENPVGTIGTINSLIRNNEILEQRTDYLQEQIDNLKRE